jgi:hypothetical protein
VEHKLIDIITIAVCAVIGGANNWVEVEQFGHEKQDWFGQFLGLPPGIPTHDTFDWVFARIKPEQFQQCFLPGCKQGKRHVTIISHILVKNVTALHQFVANSDGVSA